MADNQDIAALLESRGQRVIDGDTFDKGGTRYRLSDVDAYETQHGPNDDPALPAAEDGTEFVRDFLEQRGAEIVERGTGRYGRTLADVYGEDGSDLQSELVRQGHARPYSRTSRDFRDEVAESNIITDPGINPADAPLVDNDAIERDFMALKSSLPRREYMDSQFGRGLAVGVDQARALGRGLNAWFRDAVGDEDENIDRQLALYGEHMERADNRGLNVEAFTDIDGPEDFADWALGGLGQAVPSLVMSVGGGSVGGLLARQGAKAAIRRRVAARANDRLGADLASRVMTMPVGQRALKQAFKRGAYTGAWAPSAGMETGSIYGDLAEEDISAPLTALLGGSVAGAADVFAQGRAIKAILGPKTTSATVDGVKELLAAKGGDILKAGIAQGITEGGTEALQELVHSAAVAYENPEVDFFTADTLEAAGNAFAMGALVGSVVGLPGGARSRSISQTGAQAESEASGTGGGVSQNEGPEAPAGERAPGTPAVEDTPTEAPRESAAPRQQQVSRREPTEAELEDAATERELRFGAQNEAVANILASRAQPEPRADRSVDELIERRFRAMDEAQTELDRIVGEVGRVLPEIKAGQVDRSVIQEAQEEINNLKNVIEGHRREIGALQAGDTRPDSFDPNEGETGRLSERIEGTRVEGEGRQARAVQTMRDQNARNQRSLSFDEGQTARANEAQMLDESQFDDLDEASLQNEYDGPALEEGVNEEQRMDNLRDEIKFHFLQGVEGARQNDGRRQGREGNRSFVSLKTATGSNVDINLRQIRDIGAAFMRSTGESVSNMTANGRSLLQLMRGAEALSDPTLMDSPIKNAQQVIIEEMRKSVSSGRPADNPVVQPGQNPIRLRDLAQAGVRSSKAARMHRDFRVWRAALNGQFNDNDAVIRAMQEKYGLSNFNDAFVQAELEQATADRIGREEAAFFSERLYSQEADSEGVVQIDEPGTAEADSATTSDLSPDTYEKLVADGVINEDGTSSQRSLYLESPDFMETQEVEQARDLPTSDMEGNSRVYSTRGAANQRWFFAGTKAMADSLGPERIERLSAMAEAAGKQVMLMDGRAVAAMKDAAPALYRQLTNLMLDGRTVGMVRDGGNLVVALRNDTKLTEVMLAEQIADAVFQDLTLSNPAAPAELAAVHGLGFTDAKAGLKAATREAFVRMHRVWSAGRDADAVYPRFQQFLRGRLVSMGETLAGPDAGQTVAAATESSPEASKPDVVQVDTARARRVNRETRGAVGGGGGRRAAPDLLFDGVSRLVRASYSYALTRKNLPDSLRGLVKKLGPGGGFFETKQLHTATAWKAYVKAVEGWTNDRKSKAAEDRINGRDTDDALVLKELFDGLRQEAIDNSNPRLAEELGYLENYIPRLYDTAAIEANFDGFVDTLMSAVTQDGEAVFRSREEAGQFAHSLLAHGGDPAQATSQQPGKQAYYSNMQKRLFDTTPEGMDQFVVTDMDKVMATYVEGYGRMIAEAKHFGGETVVGNDIDGNPETRWVRNGAFLNALEDGLENGMDPEDVRYIGAEVMDAAMGRLTTTVSTRTRNVMAGVQMYQNFRTLLFSTLSSFVDVSGVLTRTGSVRETMAALGETLRKEPRQELREIGETLGLMGDAATQRILDQMYNDGMAGPAWVQKGNDKLFTWIGMKTWTDNSRVMALAAGKRFLAKHAEAYESNERSREYLDELAPEGMTGAELAAEVVLWDRAGGKLSGQFVDLESDEKAVAQALHKFVNSTIMNPNAGQRPVWGSDARFMLVMHLKQFMWSFHHTVLQRAIRELRQRYQDGGIPAAGVYAATNASLLFGLAAAGLVARNFLQYGLWGDEPPEDREMSLSWGYFGELADRTGGAGIAQLALDGAKASERGQNSVVALLGPTAGQAWDFLDSMTVDESGKDKKTQPALGKGTSNELFKAVPVLSQITPLRHAVINSLE